MEAEKADQQQNRKQNAREDSRFHAAAAFFRDKTYKRRPAAASEIARQCKECEHSGTAAAEMPGGETEGAWPENTYGKPAQRTAKQAEYGRLR